MSYQVLARKYRPQTFTEVIGQEPVVRALTNALRTDRTAHAYLFSGIRGVGKTTAARLLARALNCESGPTPDPCGTCPSCTEIAAGSSLDVIEIDAATYTKVENMREVLEKTRYSPARDAFKVYIVDEVHMLSSSSFNALLKTLEEPPGHVVFILATTELRKVPATIVSRCQHYEFRPVSHALLVSHLKTLCEKESAEVSGGALSLIARRAGGSIRDSQSLLDLVLCYGDGAVDESQAAKILGIADSRALSGLVSAMKDGDAAAALTKLEEILSWGTDPVQLHSGLVEHVRNLLVTQVVEKASEILPAAPEEIEEWRTLAARFRPAELLRLLQVLARGELELRQASQPRYLLEGLLVRCSLLESLSDLESVLREIGSPAPSRPIASTPSAEPEAREKPSTARTPKAERPEHGKEPADRPSSSSANVGSGDAPVNAILGALKRASLKRWMREASVSLDEGCLRVELPAGSETAARQLQGKSARQSLLDAARVGLGGSVTDLQVTVREGDQPVPEPPREDSSPPPEAEEAGAAGAPGMTDRPEVQTLMEVFDGKIQDGDQES